MKKNPDNKDDSSYSVDSDASHPGKDNPSSEDETIMEYIKTHPPTHKINQETDKTKGKFTTKILIFRKILMITISNYQTNPNPCIA